MLDKFYLGAKLGLFAVLLAVIVAVVAVRWVIVEIIRKPRA
jgi:hypothetical protein